MSAGNRIACAMQKDDVEDESELFLQIMVNAYDNLLPATRKRVQDAPFRLCCLCILQRARQTQKNKHWKREDAEQRAFDKILAYAYKHEEAFQKT